MTQRQQQHIALGVGIEHDMASQHKFSEVWHPDRACDLDGLLRLVYTHDAVGYGSAPDATGVPFA